MGFKLEDLQTHPYNKIPGNTYFYLDGTFIQSEVLSKMSIDLKYKPNKLSVDDNEPDKKISVYFSYKMANGKTPVRLYEDREVLKKEVNDNLNK